MTPLLPLLILTVGAGPTGPLSNLAQGLVNTLQPLRPRLFSIVPSASPGSTIVAELVRDGIPPGCISQPWCPSPPFRQIQPYDGLFAQFPFRADFL